MTLPSSAGVVIIGGGAVGVSIAFHLAEAGVPDVVLVERHEPGAGSTSRAAGGVRAQFSDALNIQLGLRSMAAYRDFAARPGQEIDLRRDGYLFLLSCADDVAAFEGSVALQNTYGVPSRMIDVAEAVRLSPMIEPTGLLGAAFSPADGYCTPESVVLGYATAARRHGARLVRDCEVVGIDVRGEDVHGVATSRGHIATSTVICAAGAWSAAVGDMVGVQLPVAPRPRQIVFTEPIGAAPMPLTIDFSGSFYVRPEGGRLLIGLSDPDAPPSFDTPPPDAVLPRFGETVGRRMPGLLDVGIAGGWTGLYEVTPDHNALIGQSERVGRFLYATGFSGHGFMQAPAVGEVVRDLVLEREPFVDVTPMAAERFNREDLRIEVNHV